MNNQTWKAPECQKTDRLLDSYLAQELSVEMAAELGEHLGRCPECRGEFEVRSALRERVRNAVQALSAPPFLEARIRNTIRASSRKTNWARRFLPVAALLVVGLGSTVSYELGHLRLTAASQEAYITSVTDRVPKLMRVALGGHIHCSVFRKFRKNPPKVEDLAKKLGPEYAPLIPILKRHVPEEYKLMIGHRCSHADRKFIHLSLKSDSRLMSLVLIRKQDDESFDRAKLTAALVQSGLPFYTARVQRFKLASFESGEHLVYLVSDLDPEKNTSMLLALAPELIQVVRKMEI